MIIFLVIAGTPAAKAGLRDGDEILSINGREALAFSLQGAREYFERALGAQQINL